MSPKIIYLALVVCLASGDASTDLSSILSRLHKKASVDGNPLILIVDKTLENRNDRIPWNKPSGDDPLPLSLVDLLNNKRQTLKLNNQHNHQHNSLENSNENYRDASKSSYDDLIRLKYRLEREKQRRERRNRRDRKARLQNRNVYTLDRKENRNVYTLDRKEDRRDKHENRDLDKTLNRDKRRERRGRINRLKNRNSDSVDRIENRARDRYNDRERADNEQGAGKLALRSAVIKNILRISNGLRCAARDQCQNTCEKFKGKRQDDCEDVCEDKFDCEEDEVEEDPCQDSSDGCEDSDEDQLRSTRGERLVTVTEKCTRC